MFQNIIKIFLLSFILITQVFGQEDIINSGPMVGYSSMREVSLWLQTKDYAEVEIVYWEKGTEIFNYTNYDVATEENAYTVKLIAEELEPGREYEYAVIIDGVEIVPEFRQEFQTQKLWQWREDPPEFTFATGSCAYFNETQYDRPGKPYGGEYEIFTSIYEKRPDFMLWLGDNVYLREADWDSRSGIVKRYTHDRATEQLQPMLSSMHHYAIWDDHDYGPDNSDRGYWNKQATMEAFELFWNNPSFGFEEKKCATTYFQWGDVDFFLLDNRTFRTPDFRKTGKREYLGEEQLNWLIDGLVTSQAPFKFVVVGGQVLNTASNNENYSSFTEERAHLLELIEKEKIEGVIFLDGDVHRAELTKLEREGAYPLYDFTTSPLTAGVSSREYANNPLLVEGTQVFKRNFAVFKIEGQLKDRKLTCTLFDSKGEEEWQYTIYENELKYKLID